MLSESGLEVVGGVTTDSGDVLGTPAEFAAWVAPHLGVLSALALREVGPADADDVVQEALIRSWRRRATFDPERGSARAWLAAVVLDQARRQRVRHPWAARLGTQDRELAPADGDRLDVERAVRELPRRQRQVVTLHYLADLPVTEVATALGISQGSVKSHLHDARAALRTVLEER